MKVLFLAGPALGHISRLITVAEEYRKIASSEILFAIPSVTSNHKIVSDAGFTVELIDAAKQEIGVFGINVQLLIKRYTPDVIVVDWNMLIWGRTIKWPDIPRILVTNFFLTELCSYTPTQQDLSFPGIKNIINSTRLANGLAPIESPKELYHADRVCLVDPRALVECFIKAALPIEYMICGACFWEMEGRVTSKTSSFSENILISLGSTGLKKIDKEIVDLTKHKVNAEISVLVGDLANDNDCSSLFDYAFDRFSLAQILSDSKCVITQGGSGSTYQALSYGVPLIIYPSHRNHEILGEILEEFGVGLLIGKDDALSKIDNYDVNKARVLASNLCKEMSLENGAKAVAEVIIELSLL